MLNLVLFGLLLIFARSFRSAMHTQRKAFPILRSLIDISKMTTNEIEEYVRISKQTRNGSAPCIIPIGSIEQHGPTGLCGTGLYLSYLLLLLLL